MQLSKQIIFGIGSIALIGALGYLLMDVSLPSSLQREDGKLSLTKTQQVPSTSNSGNAWGANPFQTGASLETPKPVFKAPNIEWKSRNVTLKDGRTVNYVFGEGDPKEVAPKKSDYQDSQEYFQSEVIRPRTEQLLIQFLTNPTLVTVINKCGPFIRPDPNSLSQIVRNFPSSLYTADFSVENMLTVNLINGHKVIDWTKIDPLADMFAQIRNYTITGSKVDLLAKQCLAPDDIPAFDILVNQFNAIGNSACNCDESNRKEVWEFLRRNKSINW